jgi:hypothetical protein
MIILLFEERIIAFRLADIGMAAKETAKTCMASW